MRHDFNPIKKPSIPTRRPSPGSATRGQDPAIRMRCKNRSAGQWRASAIAGLIIVAVLVGLEVSRKAPVAPAGAIREIVPGEATKIKAAPARQVDERVIDENANVKQEASIPAPAESPVPQNASIPQTSEAELLGKEAPLVLTDLDSRRADAVLRDKELFGRTVRGRPGTRIADCSRNPWMPGC